MAVETFLTGFGGNFSINTTTTFSVISWSLQITAQENEFVGSRVGNHPIVLTTFTRAVGTVEIDYSDADQPFQPSQGSLVAGTPIINAYFQLSPASGDGWLFSNMIIVGTPQSLQRAGKIMTSLSMKSSGGLWTPPGSGSPSF